MKVEDLRSQDAGWQFRLHEKCGKYHTMPCHRALAEALSTYIDAAGIVEDCKRWLFRTACGHTATTLSEQLMGQTDAWRMIRRRATAAGIHAPSAITASVRSESRRILPMVACWNTRRMAVHESPRTTKRYNRTKERLTQDEVERIRL
jgi:hypothetical protein